MNLAKTMEYLQYLQAAAALFLMWRLLQFGLLSEMKAMFGQQVWTMVSSLGTVALFRDQEGYKDFYSFLIPIGCVIHVLAVRELFSIVFERYPGIRTMGRWMMYFAMILSILVSFVIGKVFWVHAKAITYAVVLDRSVLFSLTVFILCILFFLSRYPLQLPRNFSISSSFFCAIFLTEAVVLLVVTLRPSSRVITIDAAETAINAFCVFLWGFLLHPAESHAGNSPSPLPSSNAAEENSLLQELESLNTVLGRAVRR